jgi:hypothetical protein
MQQDVEPAPSGRVERLRSEIFSDLFKYEEAAKAIEKHPRTIMRLAARGELVKVIVAGTAYITGASLKGYVKAQSPGVPVPAPRRPGRPTKAKQAA